MFREVRSISKVLTVFILCAAAFSGCTTATDKAESRLKIGEPVSETYNASYEEVESAIKQAMIKYPQRIDNTEAGIFETDYVKGDARFKPAHATTDLSNGYRYRLLLRLIRGKKDDRPVVKVSITKQIQLVRDFFADPDMLASDGLEEHSILYRIGREIAIARAMKKASNESAE